MNFSVIIFDNTVFDMENKHNNLFFNFLQCVDQNKYFSGTSSLIFYLWDRTRIAIYEVLAVLFIRDFRPFGQQTFLFTLLSWFQILIPRLGLSKRKGQTNAWKLHMSGLGDGRWVLIRLWRTQFWRLTYRSTQWLIGAIFFQRLY